MWMMGYNDGGGGELNSINNNNNNTIQDSFSSRRLRQLMPRPAIATTSTSLIHAATHDHLLALNHHYAMAEQNKRELNHNIQQIVVSSRWNPTPEQLQTLEELYRRGTRTPSAEEIQLITSQLRRYGKIEGKNVFYWFQNHKARERQKRRRQVEPPLSHQHPNDNNNNGEKKESLTAGANRSVYEVEQTKNWASPTNSSTIASEKQGGGVATECKGADDGWLQFDYDNEAEAEAEAEAEILQQQRKNATWQQMMHLSCSSSPLTNNNNNLPLINSSCSAPTTITTVTATTTTTTTTIPSTVGLTMEQHLMPKHKFCNIFAESYGFENLDPRGEAVEVAQTLQLFPLLSQGDEKDNDSDGEARMNSTTNVTPYPFFEFLPLKN